MRVILIFHRNSRFKKWRKKKIKNFNSSAGWKRWRNFSSIIRMENLFLSRAIKKDIWSKKEREREWKEAKIEGRWSSLCSCIPCFSSTCLVAFFFSSSASQKTAARNWDFNERKFIEVPLLRHPYSPILARPLFIEQ